MSVTAKLVVRLYAGDVLVAESEDAQLWRGVLSAMSEGRVDDADPPAPSSSFLAPRESALDVRINLTPLARMASEIDTSPEILEGACAPSGEPPFIHLDPRCWEAMRKNHPPRGPGAISPIALAGTLLALWSEFRSAPPPSPDECQAVLGTLHLRDTNGLRSLRNCSWLQLRNDRVVVNPAQRSKALGVAKAFATKTKVSLDG